MVVDTPTAAVHPDNNWILVIDDDPVAQQLMTRTLTRNGYNVEGALGGVAGLEAARKRLPLVITLDIDMPGMSG